MNEDKSKSILDFWIENEPAYQDATKKQLETYERGKIFRKALFSQPHRDIALYCTQENGAELENLTSHFGDEVRNFLDELVNDGIVVVRDSTYQTSDDICNLYKSYNLL